MSYVAPTSRTTGAIITAQIWNQDVVENVIQVKALTEIPVGFLVFNASASTNPATTLGYGTWSLYGAGRTLVCVDSGQTEFDSIGEMGGAKTVTIATANLPASGLTVPFGDGSGRNNGAAQGLHGTDTTIVASGAGTATTSNMGSGTAMSVMNPYITVYCWRRTA